MGKSAFEISRERQQKFPPPFSNENYHTDMSKAVVSATGSLASSMTPTRLFFRLSQKVPSINHARAVFATIGKFGDMVEYKFMRVSIFDRLQLILFFGHILTSAFAVSRNTTISSLRVYRLQA